MCEHVLDAASVSVIAHAWNCTVGSRAQAELMAAIPHAIRSLFSKVAILLLDRARPLAAAVDTHADELIISSHEAQRESFISGLDEEDFLLSTSKAELASRYACP